MGMYDNFYVEDVNILPISVEYRKIIEQDRKYFQTKDFDNLLDDIILTSMGYLTIKHSNWHVENNNGLLDFYNGSEKEEQREINLDFTGDVNFYHYTDDYCFEFYAKFLKGQLIKIEGGLDLESSNCFKRKIIIEKHIKENTFKYDSKYLRRIF